jgi:hypothetical protein
MQLFCLTFVRHFLSWSSCHGMESKELDNPQLEERTGSGAHRYPYRPALESLNRYDRLRDREVGIHLGNERIARTSKFFR